MHFLTNYRGGALLPDDSEPIVRRHFEYRETAVTILAQERFMSLADNSIFDTREVVERFIAFDHLFQDTLEPYQEQDDAHPIIKHMCDAARKANVGPMATVAGVVAEEAVKAMMQAGTRQAVVDNGGDIAMLLSEPIDVGIFTLNSRFAGLGLHCIPSPEIQGICTSSKTVGPSLSFGVADAATVVSKDVTLADACATRLGNLITSDDEETVRKALDDIMNIEGVDGALVIVGERLAFKGSVPKLVRIGDSKESVARREFR